MLESQDLKRKSERLEKSNRFMRTDSLDKEKFRSSLNILESERHNLLETLRDLEKKYEIQVEKCQELGRNLNFQSEHISQLELEKAGMGDKIKQLQTKVIEFESLYSGIVQERNSLKMSLSQLQEENQKIDLKLGEKEAFMEFISKSYNEEKDTIVNVHQKHSRLLTSKILFDIISKIAMIRKNSCFSIVKSNVLQGFVTAKNCLNLVNRKINNRMKETFFILKENMRLVKIDEITQKIVDKRYEEKLKRKVFQNFHEKVNKSRGLKNKYLKAARKIKTLEKFKRYLKIFQCVQQWKNVKIRDIYGKNLLKALLFNRKYKKTLKNCVDRWRKINKTLKETQAKEDLATEISAFSLKQSIFSELKRITQVSSERSKMKQFMKSILVTSNRLKFFFQLKHQTQLQKLRKTRISHILNHSLIKSESKFFQSWKSLNLTHKKYNQLVKVFKSKNKNFSSKSLEKIFQAWKVYFFSSKYQKVHLELSKEKPLRTEYQNAYTELKNFNNNILMTKAISNMIKSCNKSIRNYFKVWQSKIYEFASGKKRIARLFIKMYSNSLEGSFIKWKKFKENMDLINIIKINSETAQENQTLIEHINNLETCLSETLKEKSVISTFPMKNILKFIRKKEIQFHFRTWAKNSFIMSHIILSCKILINTSEKIFKRDALSEIRKFTTKKIKKESRERKLYIFTFKKWNNVNMMVLNSWVNYVRLLKFHRKKLSKILIKRYKNTSSFSFSVWKKFIDVVEKYENKEKYNILENHVNQLQEELEETCNNLSIQIDNNWKLQQTLDDSIVKKGLRTIFYLNSNKMKETFEKWKESVKFKKNLIVRIKKIFGLDNKVYYRSALKKWVNYKNLIKKVTNENSVNTLIVEKKVIRREMNQLKNKLEETISIKENIIEEYKEKQEKMSKTIEKFVKSAVRKKNDLITTTKSAWAFTQWKILYSKKKSLLQKIFRIGKREIFRNAFGSIKIFLKTLSKAQDFKTFICELFLSFRVRKLKHSFTLWRINNFKFHEKFKSKELEHTLNKLQMLALKHHNSKKISLQRSLNFINNKSKLFIIKHWSLVSKKLKNIRKSTKNFMKASRSINLKHGLKMLYQHKSVNKRNALIILSMRRYNLQYLLDYTFGNWKFLYKSSQSLQNSLKRISEKFELNHLIHSFGCIKTFSVHISTDLNWRCFSKSAMVKSVFNSYLKSSLSTSFQIWHRNAVFFTNMQRKITTIVSSTSNRMKLKFFHSWVEKVKLINVSIFTEKYGKSAIENWKLRRLLQIYHKFIKKQGITTHQIDVFLSQNLSLSENLERKSSKSDLLLYTFTILKSLVIKKKKILHTIHRVQIFKKKGEILKAFNTWKKICIVYSKELRSMPRETMIRSIANMDKEINSLQNALKEKHLSIRYLESYSEVLEEQVRRGQNQALANCAGNIKITLKSFMAQWLFNVKTQKMHELFFRLRDVEDELIYISRKCKDFDIENKELLIENKNLIKNNYEARELVVTIKNLNVVKQKLEEEVFEKSDTIRKLIQENRELAIQLSSFRYN